MVAFVSFSQLFGNLKDDPEFWALLNRGTVFRIEDKAMGFRSDKKHWWFIINKNPKENEIIIMPCGTSQNTPLKNANYSSNPKTQDGILLLSGRADYAEFSKPTVIDCNKCRRISRLDLVKMYKEGKLTKQTEATQELINKMVEAFENGTDSDPETLKLLK